MVPEGRRYTEDTKELLSLIDVLVDGPYVAELYDITLNSKVLPISVSLTAENTMKQESLKN